MPLEFDIKLVVSMDGHFHIGQATVAFGPHTASYVKVQGHGPVAPVQGQVHKDLPPLHQVVLETLKKIILYFEIEVMNPIL